MLNESNDALQKLNSKRRFIRGVFKVNGTLRHKSEHKIISRIKCNKKSSKVTKTNTYNTKNLLL